MTSPSKDQQLGQRSPQRTSLIPQPVTLKSSSYSNNYISGTDGVHLPSPSSRDGLYHDRLDLLYNNNVKQHPNSSSSMKKSKRVIANVEKKKRYIYLILLVISLPAIRITSFSVAM